MMGARSLLPACFRPALQRLWTILKPERAEPGLAPVAPAGPGGGWKAWALVTVVGLGLFAARLAGPPDVINNDQERPAAYILDAVRNGHWVCQRDVSGDITSKPPLYTWLGAAATLMAGELNRFTLYLPCAFSVLGIAWLLLGVGRGFGGANPGLMAGLLWLVSLASFKLVVLARTDALFAATVTLAALLGFRAWQRGRGWTAFWLAGAAATLTKGPLGLALASGGLLAVWWERTTRVVETGPGSAEGIVGDKRPLPGPESTAPRRGSHWLGVLLFLALVGGWFLLAYLENGEALTRKMLGKELARHAVTGRKGSGFGTQPYLPFLYFLSRFAPWSLLACVGFWRVWKQPARAEGERRFERFLFCWFWAGLVVFSFAASKRADHLFPLLPAAALLAGRELDRWLRRPAPAVVLGWGAAIAAALLAATGLVFNRAAARPDTVELTLALKGAADRLRAAGSDQFPVTHAGDPFALQFFRNTMRPWTSMSNAAALLRGEAAAFVSVSDLAALRRALGDGAPPLHELIRWPAQGEARYALVSNHPRLEWTPRMAFCFGSLEVTTDRARLQRAGGSRFEFAAGPAGAGVVANHSTVAERITVTLTNESGMAIRQTLLRPGAVLRVEAPGKAPAQPPSAVVPPRPSDP